MEEEFEPLVAYKTTDNDKTLFLVKDDIVYMEIEDDNIYINDICFDSLSELLSLSRTQYAKLLTDWLMVNHANILLPNQKLIESINNNKHPYMFICWRPYWDKLSEHYKIVPYQLHTIS